MKKILIGAPVRQHPVILNLYLLSLQRLDTENLLVDYFFIDDNDNQESSKILEAFGMNEHALVQKYSETATESYHKDEHTHYWTGSLIEKVADIKNQIIAKALNGGYDYLFLIDSDLILHKNTLKRLIETDQEIISEIFWTKWTPDANELPQVWLRDHYTLFQQRFGEFLTPEETNRRTDEFLEMLRVPGVYEVGGLGALTLIKREVLEAGVHFGAIKNVSFWGEDRHFCIRAVSHGFNLHVDTHYPALHLYRESSLTELTAAQLEALQSPIIDEETT